MRWLWIKYQVWLWRSDLKWDLDDEREVWAYEQRGKLLP